MFSPDHPPAATASANDSTKDAPVISDVHAHEHQPTQSIAAPSASVIADSNGQQDTPGPSTRSLFGPFPETENTSNAGECSAALPETRQMPESQAQGHVEPSNEDRHQVDQPALNFDPQDRDLSNPSNLNAPDIPDKSVLPPLTREKTGPAIGPATDKPSPVTKLSELEGPVLFITLLLTSTGTRHPYKLDEKYLRKRNVSVDGNNPINISLYKLKELILRDWRDGELHFRLYPWFFHGDVWLTVFP